MRRGGMFFGALSISAIISAICIFSLSCQALAEEISITTYYPSPYGSYEELRSNKMVIGETDASKIDTPPLGGLTLAPQVIGVGTTAPEGTLMYDKGKKTLTYWNGDAWQAVKKEDIFVGTANMKNTVNEKEEINTGGVWKDLEINSAGVESYTDSDGCQYAKAVNNKMMMVSADNNGCKALKGGGIYKVSWEGRAGVNADNEGSEFILQLFGTRTGVGVFDIDEITLKEERACEEGCMKLRDQDISICSGCMDTKYYDESFDGETLVSVPATKSLVVGIRARTLHGGKNKIVGRIENVKFQVDKVGID